MKGLLQEKLKIGGRERPFKNGILWSAKQYTIYWNLQVIKKGEYPKDPSQMMPKKRLADIVLCDRRNTPYNWDGGLPDPIAILAIELKNTNLQFKWRSAWMFDRDVLG